MICGNSARSIAFAGMLLCFAGPAGAAPNYPDWSGQWTGLSVGQWDPSTPAGRRQQAPLTPEYQARIEAAQADMRAGGRGDARSMTCVPQGMPRAMLVYEAMEIIIQPTAAYMMFEFMDPLRRIYTDGRDWPTSYEPTWLGYSVGRWEGAAGDDKYDTLVVETRNFKGPRVLDGSLVPLHEDNQTVVKERIFLDKDNSDILRDDVTLIDHAFTQPWTVTRSYKRNRTPVWTEYNCADSTEHVSVGSESYLISADGYLMPTRKGQLPPDSRYFDPQGK